MKAKDKALSEWERDELDREDMKFYLQLVFILCIISAVTLLIGSVIYG